MSLRITPNIVIEKSISYGYPYYALEYTDANDPKFANMRIAATFNQLPKNASEEEIVKWAKRSTKQFIGRRKKAIGYDKENINRLCGAVDAIFMNEKEFEEQSKDIADKIVNKKKDSGSLSHDWEIANIGGIRIVEYRLDATRDAYYAVNLIFKTNSSHSTYIASTTQRKILTNVKNAENWLVKALGTGKDRLINRTEAINAKIKQNEKSRDIGQMVIDRLEEFTIIATV
jgi:hypothetical protein